MLKSKVMISIDMIVDVMIQLKMMIMMFLLEAEWTAGYAWRSAVHGSGPAPVLVLLVQFASCRGLKSKYHFVIFTPHVSWNKIFYNRVLYSAISTFGIAH